MEIIDMIKSGKTALGIEFGSTRIKAVLVDENNKPIAQGGFGWENKLENGIWTYSIDDIITGLQTCYADLAADVEKKYGAKPETIGAIGISAMMHGYMAFDKDEKLLVPFRTWRNTRQAEAADFLTDLFSYPIPQRWSIAHLYQAILNNEEHVSEIKSITTLAGYVHRLLTGKNVLGVGEASGMFPIDLATGTWNKKMLESFDGLEKVKKYSWRIENILPEVLNAGENAGQLTESGAKLLDKSGTLKAGIPFCPPEGDAGTGMAATNSVAECTGNVSAGTSVFAMIVLEHELSKVYKQIDLVTTPSGKLVAMVHCNNCTSDINAWVELFDEFAKAIGAEVDMGALYTLLFKKAMEGDKDCGGLLMYNYFSGEHVTGFEEGRPLLVRKPDSKFTLANFMRTNLYTSLGALKTGLDILLKNESVKIKSITGHGGLFKTEGVGQSILAGAINAPVSVMETAGEGGAWGIALLASYMVNKNGMSLEKFLDEKVFAGEKCVTCEPCEDDVKGFEKFMESYTEGLAIERAAVEHF